jgi:hypothetical protein
LFAARGLTRIGLDMTDLLELPAVLASTVNPFATGVAAVC